MQRQIILLLISFLLFHQNILFAQTSEPAFYEDEVAYEVYSAILSLPEATRWSKSKNFVIRLETNRNFGAYLDDKIGHPICLRDAESKEITGTAIDDYIKVNKKIWRLREKFNLEIPYKLVSTEVIASIVKKEGWAFKDEWDEFYKQYPDSGGFFEFSAVGFNAEKTVAIVTKGRWCGLGCGEGEYYVLQKKDGEWIRLTGLGGCNWIN